MLEVTLLGVNGKEYLLTGSERASEVLAPVEALAGLVGSSSRSDLAVPGRSGVIPGRRRYGPIETELPFYLHADDGDEMGRVYREFRQAWPKGDPGVGHPATVRVHADHPLGAFTLPLWLGQPLPGVPVDMRRRTSATVTASVFSPQGLFRFSQSGADLVTVTNLGDEVVYPRIEYSGAGGLVVSPSGATFILPTVETPTVVDLDPRKLRLDGAFPEGVKPGESGIWSLPEGVTLHWELLVADPWA